MNKSGSPAAGSAREIVIGMLGFGVVGSQVYQALTDNKHSLAEKTGFTYRIKKILVRNLQKPRSISVPKELLTTNPEEILTDPEISVAVEAIGGLEQPAVYIEKLLRARKSVVTANKQVMATYGEKLFPLAAQQNVDLFFEASVGGAIPILRPLQESLATDRILEVSGIVNGTTNYILTRMTRAGSTYQEALEEAKRLGYAEPDPTFDVSGMDASFKIAILSSLAFGFYAKGEEVYREGIAGILPDDIRDAKELGYRIKLLATARCEGKEVSLAVTPTLIPASHPLYNVEGPYNAILVRGERLGDIMFYGQGAGGVPTSTAVVSDLVQAAKNLALGINGKTILRRDGNIRIKPPTEMESRFYFRLDVENQPGAMALVAKVFGDHRVNFSFVLQKENTEDQTDIVFLTYRTSFGAVRASLQELGKFPLVKAVRSVLRVES